MSEREIHHERFRNYSILEVQGVAGKPLSALEATRTPCRDYGTLSNFTLMASVRISIHQAGSPVTVAANEASYKSPQNSALRALDAKNVFAHKEKLKHNVLPGGVYVTKDKGGSPVGLLTYRGKLVCPPALYTASLVAPGERFLILLATGARTDHLLQQPAQQPPGHYIFWGPLSGITFTAPAH